MDGQTIAILYTGFDLTHGLQSLANTVKEIKVGQTGRAVLIAGKNHPSEGDILVSRKMTGNVKQISNGLGDTPFAAMLSQSQGSVTYQWKDNDNQVVSHHLYYRAVPGWNWVLGLDISDEEILATSRLIQNTLIGMTVVSLIVTLVAVSILLLKMLAPLTHLSRSLEQIGQGDLNIELPATDVNSDCKNEISLLRQKFASDA